MGGGAILLARSTNFRFYVQYSTSAGFDYRGFLIQKIRTEDDGKIQVDWVLEPGAWSMSEEEQEKFATAMRELEEEHQVVWQFGEMTKSEKALGDIWNDLKDAERSANIWQRRATEAEAALHQLHEAWGKLEDAKRAIR